MLRGSSSRDIVLLSAGTKLAILPGSPESICPDQNGKRIVRSKQHDLAVIRNTDNDADTHREGDRGMAEDKAVAATGFLRAASRLAVTITVLTAASLCGCSTIYVHNADTEKSTASARAVLDTVKIGDVFDRQQQYFNQLQSEELQAVIARDAAQRDQQLALFLMGNKDANGLSLLSEDIRAMTLALYDGSQPTELEKDPDKDPAHPLWRRLDLASRAQVWDTTILKNYQRVVKGYRDSGGRKPTDCEMAQLSGVDAGESQEQSDRYQQVLKACEQIAKMRGLSQEATGTVKPVAPELSAVAFNYQEARDTLAGLQASLAEKKSASQKLGADLDAAQKELQQKLAVGKTSRAELDDVITKINRYLGDAQKAADNPYVRKVLSDKLSADIKTVLDATTPVDPKCKESAGTDAGGSSGCPTPSVARASLDLFQAAASLEDAFSDPPRIPHPNVLAVASAQMSYNRDVANAEIARLEGQIESARRRLEAFATALYMLSRAREEIRGVAAPSEKNKGAADFLADKRTEPDQARHVKGALYYYVQAWNRGQTLADEIGVEQRIDLRRAALEGSRRAAQEWTDTIKPGLDTLVQYGAGGIDPKSIAQILGNLGLVATGVGVNR